MEQRNEQSMKDIINRKPKDSHMECCRC